MHFKRIYIEITNNCNLNCSFCAKSNREKKEMTLSEFHHVLQEIAPYTNNIYLHVKGEPLLHSHLDEILTYCDNFNMKVNITTNGTLLKEKAKMLRKHSSLSHLYLSLHSENNKENYLQDIFIETAKFSKKVTIIYRFWTLENGKINSKIANILEKMREYYNLGNEKMKELKTTKNIKISENIYVDKADLFEWPKTSLSNKEDGHCLGGKTHVAILSDGTVVPCCLDDDGIISLGNIFKQSFAEIINGSRFQNLRNSFENNKAIEPLCQKCTYKARF